MRFLRRGGDGGGRPIEARLEAFWAWWAGAKDGIAADIAEGRVTARAPEISKAVDAVDAGLAWELAKGRSSQHMLVVTPEGNATRRPIALRWAASAPPPDATWEYHASRQPGPLATLGIAGATVDLTGMRAVASWDETRAKLSVRLWHPAFDALPAGARTQIAFLFLDQLIGEEEVERWIGAVDTDPSAQAGRTPDELRDEVNRRAAVSTDPVYALSQLTDARGDVSLVRFQASLKRIDHPYASQHLAVTLDRGLDHAGDTAENAAIAEAEEALTTALDGVAVEAAHITDRRRRITHFVCEDGERALAIARDWAAAHRAWGATAKVDADPDWEFRRSYGE